MDSYPLITMSEAKAFLDIREETTKDEPRLRTLITLATNDLEIATDRRFTRQTFVEYLTTRDNKRSDYSFSGSNDYGVTHMPLEGGTRTIVSPTSFLLDGVNIDEDTLEVWYNGNAMSADDFSDNHKLVNGKDYQLDTENSKLVLYVGTTFRMRALKITYTAGYAAAPTQGTADEITLSASAPDWLKGAALIQLQFLNVKLKRDNVGMGSERTASEKGKVASSYFLKTNGLTPEVIPHVAHLRRPRTGRQ